MKIVSKWMEGRERERERRRKKLTATCPIPLLHGFFLSLDDDPDQRQEITF